MRPSLLLWFNLPDSRGCSISSMQPHLTSSHSTSGRSSDSTRHGALQAIIVNIAALLATLFQCGVLRTFVFDQTDVAPLLRQGLAIRIGLPHAGFGRCLRIFRPISSQSTRTPSSPHPRTPFFPVVSDLWQRGSNHQSK
jgi:hypothetical protein